jgi:hypothetical protein
MIYHHASPIAVTAGEIIAKTLGPEAELASSGALFWSPLGEWQTSAKHRKWHIGPDRNPVRRASVQTPYSRKPGFQLASGGRGFNDYRRQACRGAVA